MELTGVQPAASAGPVSGERRRMPRQKVHTPAYASFNDSSLAADLSAILDISEAGVAIQTATPLETDRNLDLCLDLSETGARVQARAHVVWIDSQGRAGLHLDQVEALDQAPLRQWLQQNALSASTGGAASEDLLSSPIIAAVEPEFPPVPDYTALLSALAAVAREVEALGSNLDAALHLIAGRALAFTRATGAAVAFCEEEVMICDAAAGNDAPPVGARFQIGSGLSGECVRTVRLLRCDDTESDDRVDRETCRGLGIRAMAVVPVRFSGKAIGVLEVFSSLPNAFEAQDEMVLQRLEEIVVAAVNRASRAHRASGGSDSGMAAPSEAPLSGMLKDATPSMPRYQKILLAAVAITVLLVLLFLMGPRLPWPAGKRAIPAASQLPTEAAAQLTPAAPRTVADASTFDDLRKLAEKGDPYAQFAVGARFATGDGVQQNYAEAVRWFTKAAEQGHVVAQATLGAYYWAGRGVTQDLSQAYFWSILARAGGDEASKYRVAVLTSRMTHAQTVAAQQQADEWLTRHQIARTKPSPGR